MTQPSLSRVSVRACAALVGLLASGCYATHRIGDPSADTRCEPTEALLIGCTGTVGTRCTGDPTITVCDGRVAREACSRDRADTLGFNDDADGLCPQLSVVCPASGSVTVNVQPFGGSPFTCTFAVRHGGVGP